MNWENLYISLTWNIPWSLSRSLFTRIYLGEKSHLSKRYLEPWQIAVMKVFCKNSKPFTFLTTWPGGKKWKSFTIFAKKASPCTFDRVLITPVFVDYKEDPTNFTQLKHFCIYYNKSEHGVINNNLSHENKKALRLVSAIFYQILILLQMITL